MVVPDRASSVRGKMVKRNWPSRGAIMIDHVKTEIEAGIMTLTLARPDKQNALSNAMYSAMSDGLERAENDPAVRAVLFQGGGDTLPACNDISHSIPHASR